MKKKLAFLFSVVFSILTVTMLPAGQGRAETITLKAVSGWPKPSTTNKSFTIFIDLVEQMTAKKYPGELKINYIGGPEAVKSMDQVQACQRGMVDMVYTTNAYYVSVLPEVDAYKLSDFTPMEERANGVWKFMNDLHEKKGLYLLGRLGLGEKFYLYLKKPIHTADLKGFNIRVSPMYLQIIKGLGGNPVVIPPTEVYAALERNVVDGFCGRPWVSVTGVGRKRSSTLLTRVLPGAESSSGQPNVWNKLPKKFRNLLTEAAVEAEKRTITHFNELAKQERPILIKEGLQVIDLPAAEKQKFLKIGYDEGWSDIIQKNPKTGPELKNLLTRKK